MRYPVDTSENAIRKMTIGEQVDLLHSAWFNYQVDTLSTERYRMKHVKDAVPNPYVYGNPKAWVEGLEEIHHCWNRDAMDIFIASARMVA